MEVLSLVLVLVIILGFSAFYFWNRQKNAATESRQLLFAKTFSRLLEGRSEGLVDDLLKTYKELDHDVSVGLALGALYRRMGKLQMALRLHRSILSERGMDSEFQQRIQTEIAKDYLSSGLLERARLEAERAMETGPIFDELRQTAVRIYLALRLWDEAGKVAGKGLSRQKSREASGRIKTEQAEWLLGNQDFKAAKAAAKKAMQLDPGNYIPVLTLSQIYLETQKYSQARSLLEKSINQFGESQWRCFQSMMKIALQMGDHTWVMPLLKSHLQDNPNDWRTKMVYADLQTRLGDTLDAGYTYLECLELAPEALFLHQKIWKLLLDNPFHSELMEKYALLMKKELPIRNPFYCVSCGVTSSQYHWQCPSCYEFGSYKERSL